MTNQVLECRVERTLSNVHSLTVVLGHETFLQETYGDRSRALSRAKQVRDRLLSGNGWTVVQVSANRSSAQ